MPTISDTRYITIVYDVNSLSFIPWDGSISIGSQQAAVASVSSVADTATSTTLLASNAARLGGSIYNDSSALLYVLYGTGTASATSYTARVYPNGFHTILGNYVGAIQGVWASDPGDGAARMTELS